LTSKFQYLVGVLKALGFLALGIHVKINLVGLIFLFLQLRLEFLQLLFELSDAFFGLKNKFQVRFFTK
jgi:hypothetical protein